MLFAAVRNNLHQVTGGEKKKRKKKKKKVFLFRFCVYVLAIPKAEISPVVAPIGSNVSRRMSQ